MHEKDKMVITFIIPVKYETKHTEHICVTDRGITVEYGIFNSIQTLHDLRHSITIQQIKTTTI